MKPSEVLRAIIEDGGDWRALNRARDFTDMSGDDDAYSILGAVIPTDTSCEVYSWCGGHQDLVPEYLHRALSLALEVERRS